MQYLSFHTIEAEETILRFAKGDEAALGFLYNKLYGPLVRYGTRIVPVEFEVSVMAQDSFLRLWEFRSRIRSLFHAYRFLRLVLRWKCYDWHRRKKIGIRIVYTGRIECLALANSPYDPQQEQQYQEKLRLITNVLPCLTPKRQTVLKLHFHYGLSSKQIARHFGRSGSRAINSELESSINYLRALLRMSKKAAPAPPKKRESLLPPAGVLTTEQHTIFHLRCGEKKSFAAIAGSLCLPQDYVQQQYVHAWACIRKQKEESRKTTTVHG